FGNTYVFEAIDPLARGGQEGPAWDIVFAPMPGLVKAVFVKAGAVVVQGERLAILEAMKMEHYLLATRDGEIAEVFVASGDQVVAGAPLIAVEEEAGEA
ncbi:acetyl-CoA carboxylase biotin carboxyl carrier protein subunit, partial [Falsihalocynthiibacter sp. S25ZX9]|uniref:acetyl-CoA carboxylase biotin carboxyl carrier protein subunit n=1 Tax=Falsihalocynthiibacter sp. S25ZX9 TaxID=3240870 RepID=UPI00350FF0CF